MAYAIDNGAWSYFQRKIKFDDKAFWKWVTRLGKDADWVVLPDIVEGGPLYADTIGHRYSVR